MSCKRAVRCRSGPLPPHPATPSHIITNDERHMLRFDMENSWSSVRSKEKPPFRRLPIVCLSSSATPDPGDSYGSGGSIFASGCSWVLANVRSLESLQSLAFDACQRYVADVRSHAVGALTGHREASHVDR